MKQPSKKTNASQNGFSFLLIVFFLDSNAVCIFPFSDVIFCSQLGAALGKVMLSQSCSTRHTMYS